MKKFIGRFLKDKKEYEKDLNLKNAIEQHRFLLHEEIKLFKDITSRKIKYFFKYKKLYLLKLICIILCGILLLVGTIFSLNSLGITYIKPEKKYEKLIIYVPDTINLEKYTENLCYPNVDFLIFYTSDSTKDFEKWKFNLSEIESDKKLKNKYESRRPGSPYWGKYQIGASARIDIGLDKISWENFKNNPELQEAAILMLAKKNKEYLKKEILKFDNKFIDGYHITESGLIAMAHNVGAGAVKTFLYSWGKNIPVDGSGKPATRYLILGGYDLNLE